MSADGDKRMFAKVFSGGFIFGVFLVCAWTMYYVSSLDVGTSQDPHSIRHIDDNESF